jgi:hypothetical protein
MRQGEGATVVRLKKYRRIMALLIQEHSGRAVDSPKKRQGQC